MKVAIICDDSVKKTKKTYENFVSLIDEKGKIFKKGVGSVKYIITRDDWIAHKLAKENSISLMMHFDNIDLIAKQSDFGIILTENPKKLKDSERILLDKLTEANVDVLIYNSISM